MKFDFIVGNPPYQDNQSNLRLYPMFYIEAMKIGKVVEMIFPINWQEPKDSNGLNKLNNKDIKEDKQIVFIKNKHNVFMGIPGAEWTNIIMWKKDYNNNLKGKQKIYFENDIEFEIKKLPITKNEIEKPKYIISICDKVNKLKEKKISSIGSASKPYGFRADPIENPKKYNLNIQNQQDETTAKLFGRKNGKRTYIYIKKNGIPKISKMFNKYKLFVVKAWGNMSPNYLGGAYSEIIIAEPNDCCSETYIEFGPFETKFIAENAKKYFYTKFFRAVFFKNKVSQNTAIETYSSVPIQDFTNKSDIDWSKSIKEIDKQLYKKYNLDKEEIDFIESHIKEME